MEARNIVYGLADPSGTIRYIGFTSNTLRYRVNNHRSTAKAGHPAPVNEWIRNVGLHEFKGVVIEEVPLDGDLKARADVWIESFRTNGKPLLNCTEAQHKARTKEALNREEVRAKMRGSVRPHTQTPEWRALISEANKGKVISPEHRKRISETHKGKIVSQETRDKIAAKAMGHTRNAGKVHSEAAKLRMSHTKHINAHALVPKDSCRWCQGEDFITTLAGLKQD